MRYACGFCTLFSFAHFTIGKSCLILWLLALIQKVEDCLGISFKMNTSISVRWSPELCHHFKRRDIQNSFMLQVQERIWKQTICFIIMFSYCFICLNQDLNCAGSEPFKKWNSLFSWQSSLVSSLGQSYVCLYWLIWAQSMLTCCTG